MCLSPYGLFPRQRGRAPRVAPSRLLQGRPAQPNRSTPAGCCGPARHRRGLGRAGTASHRTNPSAGPFPGTGGRCRRQPLDAVRSQPPAFGLIGRRGTAWFRSAAFPRLHRRPIGPASRLLGELAFFEVVSGEAAATEHGPPTWGSGRDKSGACHLGKRPRRGQDSKNQGNYGKQPQKGEKSVVFTAGRPAGAVVGRAGRPLGPTARGGQRLASISASAEPLQFIILRPTILASG